jgi:hypothetical protein
MLAKGSGKLRITRLLLEIMKKRRTLRPFTVSLFAPCGNNKCARFYSRSFEKGKYNTDALAQKWDGECIYAAPSVTLIMCMIRKIVISELNGVIIFPLWKGAKFWTYAFS